MESKPFIVVSDIHLGAVPSATERAFREFLLHAKERASGLLINGDLFDFWFEYRTVIHRQHFRVIARIAEVVDAGVPVWFTGGNHDAWGGSFLRDEVGIRLLDGQVRMELAGRRTLVTHGDGVGTGDRGYRMLKWLIRNRWTVAAFRQLHPDLGSRVARFVSTTEDKVGRDPEAARGRAEHVRRWAVAQLTTDPALDLVLAGHVHRPAVVEVAPGRFYANSGDWIHHFTYLEIPAGPGAPKLMRWDAGRTGTGAGSEIDVQRLDRLAE
jgi:UDP-2,3-diacylglucosamine hydrolase